VAEPSETGGRRPPRAVGEALARARNHARLAAAEALAAVRALLDAASLAAAGAPSDAVATTAPRRNSTMRVSNACSSATTWKR